MKHLLSINDVNEKAIKSLVANAIKIKKSRKKYQNRLFEKSLLMIFEAPSLRTRLSFETAMTQLHGEAINYYTAHSPWGLGKEAIEDVAKVVSRYCDAVTARIYSHEELKKLAENASVPIINAMTNDGHPCQILSDLLTIYEKKKKVTGLRIAYLGDARNNVTYSWMRAAMCLNNELRIACPKKREYRPATEMLQEIETTYGKSKGKIMITSDAKTAVENADVVYTDSWMSYRVPKKEKEKRLKDLKSYKVTEKIMGYAKKNAIFMHCLPALRGQEVMAEVIDGKQSVVFDQAENRLHMQKAILLNVMK